MRLTTHIEGAPHLVGWYLGIIIAFAVIVVVVMIVASLLTLATRIGQQAMLATQALNQVRRNTDPLAGVANTNRSALAILNAAQIARKALGG